MNHPEDDFEPDVTPPPHSESHFSEGLDDTPFAENLPENEGDFESDLAEESESEADGGDIVNPNQPSEGGGKKKKRRRRRRKKKGGGQASPELQPETPAPVASAAAEVEIVPVSLTEIDPEFVEEIPFETEKNSPVVSADEEPLSEPVGTESEAPIASPASPSSDGGHRKERHQDGRGRHRGESRSPKSQQPPIQYASVPADDYVEEGDAPDEVEDDETFNTEQPPHAAIEDEIAEEVAHPHEWQVMTWNELVSKLYRPS
jgi:ribonuclease E